MIGSRRRARLALVLAATISLSLAGATGAIAASNGASGLVATATKAVKVGTATLLGPAPASQVLNIDVALKPRHGVAEGTALRDMYTAGSATYHQFLTPTQFAAEYAPSPAAIAAVTSYLTSHGFTDVTVLPDDLFVTATGTVAAAGSAFDTGISDFLQGALSFYANTAPALIPKDLAGVVEAVIGLDDIPLPTPEPALPKNAGSINLAGLTPKAFQTTYDAKGTATGSGTNIALLTEGDIAQVISDLRLAEAKNGLPQVPVTQINVGVQSTDRSGQDEFDLDTQSSTAMATTVHHLYLYNIGSLVDSSVDDDIATFVAQDKATAMSASIGGCDLNAYLDGSMVATDTLLQEGAMQGQTLFASSGDNGEGCEYLISVGAPIGFPGTNWPASGEFTTAVGGTSLVSDGAGNRIAELGWIGSGGGISEVENPGWWTQDSDPGYSLQYVTGGRAVPDISLDADPNVTPALIYVDGKVEGVGGTSLASPLMLGAWARLQSAHANHLGLASIDLYQLYDRVNPGIAVPGSPIPVVVPSPDPKAVPGFTDVLLGTNGLYVCLPGYDEVTGIGAPNIAVLDHQLG